MYKSVQLSAAINIAHLNSFHAVMSHINVTSGTATNYSNRYKSNLFAFHDPSVITEQYKNHYRPTHFVDPVLGRVPNF